MYTEKDIRSLASGTIAVLLREAGFPKATYDDVDYIQESFYAWYVNSNTWFLNWAEAWKAFVAVGGLLDLREHDYTYGDI